MMELIQSIWQAIHNYIVTYADNFLVGAELFFTINNIVAVFGGVAIGCFFGALPGMSITMSVVLIMPFTFGLEPLTGLSILIAVYVGAIYGGSISAILLNTPGTPAASCTALDGFQLTQQGKAGKALHMANWASMVGDLFSTVIVIIAFPLLANLAIYFTSPEYFALILFSITVIGGVAGKSILLGLLSGCLGFLLATVGIDPITGGGRFDFGHVELLKGFSFVPLLIGLFAIPEILRQLGKGSAPGGSIAIVDQSNIDSDANRLTWDEFKTSFPHMIRGGVVGLLLGIIPGLGATPAAFVSYEWARRSSKQSSQFGKGSLEGIAAAEAGNNAVNGATLVPLLTLGIPGDVITAVMLGAFLIFDLQPGPLLFTNHADIVFGLFSALLMCDVALRLIGIVFIRFGYLIALIPAAFVFPAVLILCTVGAYSISSSLFDVLVMISFGIFGYLMWLCGTSTIPFLIAFIMAPLLEKGLRRSLTISDGDISILFNRPIAIFFYLLTIIAIYSIIKRRVRAKSSEELTDL